MAIGCSARASMRPLRSNTPARALPIAAVLLAPNLAKPDEAYPTMMRLLPTGLLGLVFAALIAAIIASTASKINSIATIFTLDIYAKLKGQSDVGLSDQAKGLRERHLVLVGRIAACVSIVIDRSGNPTRAWTACPNSWAITSAGRNRP